MARADYENRVIEKAKAARMVLSQLPSWMWKCDMPQSDQFENESYIQFTELLQVRKFFRFLRLNLAFALKLDSSQVKRGKITQDLVGFSSSTYHVKKLADQIFFSRVTS